MGRLEQLRINAYLSEVARGYNNNAFIAQTLFPTIYSEKEKIDIFIDDKEKTRHSVNLYLAYFVLFCVVNRSAFSDYADLYLAGVIELALNLL